MHDAPAIKNLLRELGADLCGVAPAERFSEAPEGFRPEDVYPDCRSVVVFAKRLPASVLEASSCVPYSHVNCLMEQQVDMMCVDLSLRLEAAGVGSVPIPTDDPYEYWEPLRSYGRGILSMRHAGQLAGLGALGRNTLLINRVYGSMIQIGAVLVDIDLAGDPIDTQDPCPPECRLCLESCPAAALDGTTVNQHACRRRSIRKTIKGYVLKKCNICRSVCPLVTGVAETGDSS